MSERTNVSTAKARIVTGVLTLAIFAIYLWQADGLPAGRMNAPGPGLFPMFVAGIILCAGVVTVFDGVMMLRRDEAFDLPLKRSLARTLAMLGALLMLAVLLPITGRVITPFLTILAITLTLSDRSWIHSLLWSIALTALVWVTFVKLLGIPLPRGVFLSF